MHCNEVTGQGNRTLVVDDTRLMLCRRRAKAKKKRIRRKTKKRSVSGCRATNHIASSGRLIIIAYETAIRETSKSSISKREPLQKSFVPSAILILNDNALFSTSHEFIFTFHVSHILMVTLYLILVIYQF